AQVGLLDQILRERVLAAKPERVAVKLARMRKHEGLELLLAVARTGNRPGLAVPAFRPPHATRQPSKPSAKIRSTVLTVKVTGSVKRPFTGSLLSTQTLAV